MKCSSPQNGSALLIVLIAIALFAALSYAVFKGGSNSTSTLSDQQVKLAAEEIIAYSNTLATAVQKLRLAGCKDTQLDFSNTVWLNSGNVISYPAGYNSNAPASGCSVFSSSDGKVTPVFFPRNYFINGAFFTIQGSSRIRKVSWPGIGDEASQELIYNLPNVTREICLKINTLLGIENPGGEPATYSAGSQSDFTGNYATSSTPMSFSSSDYNGKSASCINGGGVKYFYQKVLIAR